MSCFAKISMFYDMFESFAPIDLKFITQQRSMHLQYILSYSFLPLSCQILWNLIRTWPMADGLHTVYRARWGWTVLSCTAASVGQCWGGRMQNAVWVFSGVPGRDSFERQLLKHKKEEEFSTWLGALLKQVVHSKEDHFPALWRQRRILKMKEISLEIPAKCSTAWRLLNRKIWKERSHLLGVCPRLALWATEICNLMRSSLLLATRN